jgi:hypothetical protein
VGCSWCGSANDFRRNVRARVQHLQVVPSLGVDNERVVFEAAVCNHERHAIGKAALVYEFALIAPS